MDPDSVGPRPQFEEQPSKQVLQAQQKPSTVEHQRFGKETVPGRTLPSLAFPVVFISVKQQSEGCLGTLCRLGVGGLKNYGLLGK